MSDYKLFELAKQGYIPKDFGGNNATFMMQGIMEYYGSGDAVKVIDRAIAALEDLHDI